MPIYAYRCTACGHAKDVLQKISDPVLTICPACQAEAFAKQVTAAGFQLKGSGWYVTDFRGGSGSGTAKSGDTVGSAGGTSSGDSGTSSSGGDSSGSASGSDSKSNSSGDSGSTTTAAAGGCGTSCACH